MFDSEQVELQQRILEALHRILHLLEHRLPKHHYLTHFTIKESFMVPLDPGQTPEFTATPQPDGAVLPAGVIPTWSCSDSTFSLTPDATGLIVKVAIPSTATVGESVTLTITATLPDGSTPTGTFTFSIGAPPPPQVSGFTIAQTA